jgi:hypothetical protein
LSSHQLATPWQEKTSADSSTALRAPLVRSRYTALTASVERDAPSVAVTSARDCFTSTSCCRRTTTSTTEPPTGKSSSHLVPSALSCLARRRHRCNRRQCRNSITSALAALLAALAFWVSQQLILVVIALNLIRLSLPPVPIASIASRIDGRSRALCAQHFVIRRATSLAQLLATARLLEPHPAGEEHVLLTPTSSSALHSRLRSP